MPNHTIRETVLKSVRKHNAFVAARKAIVAVSGGCDSVALLHLLLSMRAEIGIELHVASLNHSLRGEAGRIDLEFVGELASQWGLDFTPGEVDVSALSRQAGVGIEEAARHARYKFLADVARREGADVRGGRASCCRSSRDGLDASHPRQRSARPAGHARRIGTARAPRLPLDSPLC